MDDADGERGVKLAALNGSSTPLQRNGLHLELEMGHVAQPFPWRLLAGEG